MRSQLQIGSVVCLYTPVRQSVHETEGINATVGILFLRMYLWWSLQTLYLVSYQVRLPQAIRVFLVVSLVCRALYYFPLCGDSTQALYASFCKTECEFQIETFFHALSEKEKSDNYLLFKICTFCE